MLVKTLAHAKLIQKRWSLLWTRHGHSFFSFDTETQPMPPYSKKEDALIPRRADVVMFSLCYQGEAYSFPTCHFLSKYPFPEDWGELFQGWFADQTIIKAMHNANYDVNIAYFGLSIPTMRNIWCTMIGAWKAAEYKDKSLKDRAPDYGRFLQATKTVDFSKLDELSHYAEQDVVATDELFQMQYFGEANRKSVFHINYKGTLEKQGIRVPLGKLVVADEVLRPFDKLWVKLVELPTLRATIRSEHRGFPFDLDRLRRIRRKLYKDSRQELKQLFRFVGHPINPNSNTDLTGAFDELGIGNPNVTKTGKMCFDAGTLMRLQGVHAFVDTLVRYRVMEKLRSVYVGTSSVNWDNLKEDDSGLEYYIDRSTGSIHATANTVGAVTGRGSSSNPNLQQIPSRRDTYALRACFTARPRGMVLAPKFSKKWLLIDLDYSQLEIRVMCLYCKDPAMEKVLRDPKGDIHQFTADEFGVPRNPTAKNLNFGMLYGGQEYMLSAFLTNNGVPTTVQQAKAYLERYDQVYARVNEFRKELLEEHQQNGHVVLFTGRWRTYIGDTRHGKTSVKVDWNDPREVHKAETTLSNNVVQGAGQDFLKASIVRSDWRCINPDASLACLMVSGRQEAHRKYLNEKARKLERYRKTLKLARCDFLLQVHDEAIYRVQPSAAEECLALLADIMSWRHYFPSTSGYNVPLVAEGGIGENWKHAKSDNALAHVKTGYEEWKHYV